MATKRISDLQVRSSFDDTVNLPGDDASQTWRVTGAQIKTYIQAQIADLMKQARDLYNLGLSASVSGNALTIALKQLDGSTDPTSSAPAKIGFRGTTAANGDSSLISATGAISTVISSGSTAGFSNGIAGKLYVYALNNGGTIELAWSGSPWDENSLQSTTAEGGAGAADSGNVLYSTTARTSKAIRLIGVITATEATAGTWATAPSEVQVAPLSSARKPPTQQKFTTGSGTYTLPTPAPLYLRVRMCGGGGGGGGSGTTSGTAATDGGSSTFGTSLLTAAGGSKGARGVDGGAGGAATVASPAFGTGMTGGQGCGGSQAGPTVSAASPYMQGSAGGSNAFGSAGASGGNGSGVGGAAAANSGGGGGGAYTGNTGNTNQTGSGGGAGAFIDAIIPSPGSSYSYAIGAGGSAQAAGASGFAGGAGAAGYIEVTEYYQ